MDQKAEKKKIAILGGGLGSMATALELTDPDANPDWKEKYEITVYQVGWRLGGKGASGRGPYGRIEEHGLHIWIGFYENAFKVMQKIYKEVQSVSDGCFKNWQDAFKKHNYIVLEEKVNGQWKNWEFIFPENNELPGTGGELPSLWSYVKMTIGWMHELLGKSEFAKNDPHKDHPNHGKILSWLESVVSEFKILFKEIEFSLGYKLLTTLVHFTRQLDLDAHNHDPKHHDLILKLLEEFTGWFRKIIKDEFVKDDETRRLFLLFEMGSTIIKGLIKDGVLTHKDSLDSIDKYDLQEWLKIHGAPEEVYDVNKSALMKGLYDLVFAYNNGEISKPNFAAGTALRSIFRITATYKGAIFWKMQAGMGDTIFTPMYLVLKNRGVKFKFFHQVRNLKLSDDKKSISSIEIGKQVNVISDEYDPLVRIQKLDCWPSEPDYNQIKEGQILKDNKINLESFWSGWKDVENVTLEKGRHFDLAVFGISIGAIPFICSDLIKANKKWEDMVKKVETVRTLALQLWLKKDLKGLGWDLPSPVIDAYEDPFNTWADMSHLIPCETWPKDQEPKNIAYFCGPMEGGIPDPDKLDIQNIEDEKVKSAGFDWLKKYPSQFWPKATSIKNNKELNFDDLVDPDNSKGEERYNSQFWHAAVDSSERYVLSVAGSTQYRLKADESGFDNLFLTGDWINNGFNAGCVEATVMSGMLASNAICGSPKKEEIVGYGHP